MRKLIIITLLVLSLTLCCLSAQAESTPMAFEEIGISLDFGNVLDATSNNVDLWAMGVLSYDPFVGIMNLQYYALDREFLTKMAENFYSFSEEMQADLVQMQSDISTDLADVIVTDIPDADTLVNMIWGGTLPEGLEIKEFGVVDTYHYFVVTRPGFVEPEDKTPFEENGVTPEQVHETYEALRVDMDAVRAAFIQCLENAELFVPVDPAANLPGQIISFETTDIDGNAVSSADLFKDNEITMVNVWGTWCHNCVGEMEELTEIHTRLQAKGCGVVGVEYEQKPIEDMKDEVRAFLEEKGINYPNVIIPMDNEILSQVTGFPTTFFVDREGRILTYPISGAMVEAYESTVDMLLAGETVDTVPDAGAVKNDSGEYHVIVYDMDGNPVEGAVIQLCDEVTCAFQSTDANGVATFNVEEQKAYDVHVLMAPEGYAADDIVYKTLDTFSDVNVFLKKAA